MKAIPRNKTFYEFKADMEPVATILPPATIKFKTKDCFGGQIEHEDQHLDDIDFSRVNPATGPVHVEGAESGDILKVKILDITLPKTGVTVVSPGHGALGEKVEKAGTRISKVTGDFAYFRNIQIPTRKMVGVIGVAPPKETYPTGTPWKHGGNMDTTDITEGATVYLPISQEGGLLGMGDCHAVQGDGEVCVAGCETSAEVTTKIDVIKNAKIDWPLVETDEETMIIASGETSGKALREATKEAVNLLSEGLELSWNDAYMLASLVVDLKVSQIVDPNKTVRAAIPKHILSIQELINACKER